MNKIKLLVFALAAVLLTTIPIRVPAIDVTGIGEIKTQSMHSSYVARKTVILGDSFQSGYGGAPYYPDSANGENQCLRSTTAPSVLADQMWWAPIEIQAFKACAGATTENITQAGQYNEPPQIAALTTDTKIVSVQIGGNDMQFGSLVSSCIFEDCVQNGHMARSAQLVDGLGPKLDVVFQAIRQKAPNAKKPIAYGYPQLLPSPSSEAGPACPYMNDAERVAGYELMLKLNTQIKNAAQRNGLVYGEFNIPNGPFVGRDICTTDSYFYAPDEGFLHPNVAGRKAMADFQALYMTYAALAK
jgi:lysophospholipase L1-like esterase